MDFANHFAGNMRDFPGNVGLLSEDSRVSHVTLTGTLCVHRVLVVSPGVLMIQDHLGHLAIRHGDPMNPMFPLLQFRILGLHHVQSLMFCEKNHRLFSIVIITHGCSSYYLVGGSFGRIIIPVLKWRSPSYVCWFIAQSHYSNQLYIYIPYIPANISIKRVAYIYIYIKVIE